MSRSTFGRRCGIGLAMAATAVVLAACDGAATHTAAGSHAAPPTATGRPGAADGAARQPGAVTTIDGTTLRVPSSKPSVLVFISISCADCSAAAKAVALASHTVGDKATFLAVDLDPGIPATALKSFLDYVDAKDLPTMIDAKAALLAKYQVSALSSVIVIDPAGKVTYRAVNPSPAAIVTAVSAAT